MRWEQQLRRRFAEALALDDGRDGQRTRRSYTGINGSAACGAADLKSELGW